MVSLINKYKSTNGLINYADFCKNIDTVFSGGADPLSVIENSKSSANFSSQATATTLPLGVLKWPVNCHSPVIHF